MKEMKYVVTRDENNKEEIFVFPKHFDHDKFAEVLSYITTGEYRIWERLYREPISAGFTDGVTCYGRSETLCIDARPVEDSGLLIGGV